VLFIVRHGIHDAAAIRYRGYNVIEALRLRGLEADAMDERHFPRRLAEALSYDIIVLVRRQYSPELAALLEAASTAGVAVVYDLDDLLFDERAVPYVEFFRRFPDAEARGLVKHWRELPSRCPYFSGSTPHLTEQAAQLLEKPSYLIPNGVNMAQLELSRQARESIQKNPASDEPRLGYFSGTRTHQDDFRLIASTLLRLMEEFPAVRLVVTGDFDLAEFPEFAAFGNRVESRPFVHWSLLPAEIARADINLIPLEINFFTEGKSNLKYYEAALLKIPSVASPTQIHVKSIEHGVNGFLAGTAEQWYQALRTLILDPQLRRQMGERAYEHALHDYVPSAIADAAVAAYQDILARHRARLGVAADALTVVVLLSDLERAVRDRCPTVTLAVELVRLGAAVTIHLPRQSGFTAAEADQFLAEHYGEPLFTIQVGGEVPCCDALLATDAWTAHRAKQYGHRAQWTAYLVSDYEPSPVAAHPDRHLARQSYKLGLRLFAFDPAVADLLWRHHQVETTLLLPWVEPRQPARTVYDEPKELLVVAATNLAEDVWNDALAALTQIHHVYPEVQMVFGGGAAPRSCQAPFPTQVIPWLAGSEFDTLLTRRPICLALFPEGSPPWLRDLMAAGCPVVAASSHASLHPLRESLDELIRVQAETTAVGMAVESLLIDRVRLIALSHAATSSTRNLPNAEAIAGLLLEMLLRTEPATRGVRDNERSIVSLAARIA
jgi:glycosyltransferase involved in cell wall biosynthesis